MKLLPDIQKDKLSVSVENVQAKHRRCLGTLQPSKGHKIWEINVFTYEIRQALYTKTTTDLKGRVTKTIETDDSCVYVSALNKKNALKVIGRK